MNKEQLETLKELQKENRAVIDRLEAECIPGATMLLEHYISVAFELSNLIESEEQA